MSPETIASSGSMRPSRSGSLIQAVRSDELQSTSRQTILRLRCVGASP